MNTSASSGGGAFEVRMGGSSGSRGVLVCAAVLLSFIAIAVLPGAASADVPPFFKKMCETGQGAGQCSIPRGVAVNSEGHILVANQQNMRIDVFTPWGVFVKGWGWDVVATGPGDDTTAPEDQFEICVPDNDDVCKAGTVGDGAGQYGLFGPQGIAIDDSDNVFVVDHLNHRVQKFSAGGEFLLMFGGEVNETSGGNICPRLGFPDDVCKAGSEGTADGQFGAWPIGSFVATDPGSDAIYVGDQGRIQKFASDGSFAESIGIPGETVQSLAVDPDGNFYAVFAASISASKPGVHKLDPAGASLCSIEGPTSPRAVATNAVGDVYVFDSSSDLIRQFESNCADKEESFAGGEFTESTGIATGTGCENGISVYVSNADESTSYVNAYGAEPDSGVCPAPEFPPEVNDQHAVSVGSDIAVLRTDINPNFFDTNYYVEYGIADCASNPCTQKPLAPGAVLDGKGIDTDRPVTVFLDGLQPGTTYHYRFVAKSDGASEPVFGESRTFITFPLASQPRADCPNQAFRGGRTAFLPDCRAYEMVSPLDKNNGDITTLGRFRSPAYPASLEQTAPDGGRFTYSSATAFGDALSAPYTSQYLASRDPQAGWSTHAISPPRESRSIAANNVLKLDNEFKAFSEDLCQAWLQHDTDPIIAPGAVEGFVNLYRRDNCAPGADAYEALNTVEPPETGPESFEMELQGISAGGDHAVFGTHDQLTPDAAVALPSGTVQVYAASSGSLRYVCVLPDGTPSGEPCRAGTATNLAGNDSESREHSVARAISANGARVFWTLGNGGAGPLFVRLNPDQPQSPIVNGDECVEADMGCTVLISPLPARFWTAAVDGSKAIFTVGGDLSEFDVEAEATTPIATGVVGVAGASEDASRIYFASTAALTGDEENSVGDKAEAGKPNLYLYEAEGGVTTFITTLAAEDVANAQSQAGDPFTVVSANPMRRAVRVSPDALHLAFTSVASLTGYDNTDVASGEADTEVFLYDADGGELRCVSCNPTGARPAGQDFRVGKSLSTTGQWVAAQIPTWTNQLYAPQVLSDDGSRLFFESFEALVPRDTNGAQDVYQWTRAASGKECGDIGAELFVAEAGGCLSLISSGESPIDSEFADATPDGKDVFIRTASSLVPQDPGLIDVYDARAGGGFAPPAPPAAPCEGEACQPASAPPPDPSPASESFRGATGTKAGQGKRRCGKGKRMVRRRGKARCVCGKGKRMVRRRGKARCVKNQRNRKHANKRHHRAANSDRRTSR